MKIIYVEVFKNTFFFLYSNNVPIFLLIFIFQYFFFNIHYLFFLEIHHQRIGIVVGLWFGARGMWVPCTIFLRSRLKNCRPHKYLSRDNEGFVGDNPLPFLCVKLHYVKLSILYTLYLMLL